MSITINCVNKRRKRFKKYWKYKTNVESPRLTGIVSSVNTSEVFQLENAERLLMDQLPLFALALLF